MGAVHVGDKMNPQRFLLYMESIICKNIFWHTYIQHPWYIYLKKNNLLMSLSYGLFSFSTNWFLPLTTCTNETSTIDRNLRSKYACITSHLSLAHKNTYIMNSSSYEKTYHNFYEMTVGSSHPDSDAVTYVSLHTNVHCNWTTATNQFPIQIHVGICMLLSLLIQPVLESSSIIM